MSKKQVRFSVLHGLFLSALTSIAILLWAMQSQHAQPQQQPQQPAPSVAPREAAPTVQPPQQIDPPEPQQGQGINFQVRAIDAASGQGLPGVRVELTRIVPTPARGAPSTATDRRIWTYSRSTNAGGLASFSNIVADRYTMPTPELMGYALAKTTDDPIPTATRASTTYTFTPGAKPAPVTFRMWNAASVDGVVEDSDGKPLPDVTVQIVEEGWTGGLRTLSLAQFVRTDKTGRFAMPAVLPGTYYLRAIPPPAVVQEQLKASDQTAEKHVAFVDTLFPNAMYFEQAAPLAIVAGVNVFGLRIEMQKSKYYSLSGRVFGIPRERQQISGLVLMRRVSFDSPFPFIWASPYAGAINVRLSPDGSFTAPNVPPGPYWAGYTPAGDVRGGTQFVIEDRDVDDFKFDVTRGATFSGKLVYEDGSLVTGIPPNQMGVFVPNMGVYQRNLSPSPVAGEFNTTGLPVGTWRLEFFGPLVIRKILIDGRTYEGGQFDLDADSAPAVVTVSRGGAAILGSVELHERAKAFVRGLVTISPLPLRPTDNPKRKNLEGNASFAVEHLEAGRYRVCAWLEEGAEVSALFGNPRYEEKFNAACETVVLSANERKQVHLKQISAPEFK